MFEKNISECLQYQFQRVQGKCCEEHGYGILVSTGSWKQLEKKKGKKSLSSLQDIGKSYRFSI